MGRFVIRQNIEHYRAMLAVTTDPAQRVQMKSCFTKKKPNSKNMTTITRRRPAPTRRLDQSHFNSLGSFAKFATMRRASSLVNRLAAVRRTGFILEIKIAERLPVGVTDDEAGVVRLIDGPWRRKAAATMRPSYPRLIIRSAIKIERSLRRFPVTSQPTSQSICVHRSTSSRSSFTSGLVKAMKTSCG